MEIVPESWLWEISVWVRVLCAWQEGNWASTTYLVVYAKLKQDDTVVIFLSSDTFMYLLLVYLKGWQKERQKDHPASGPLQSSARPKPDPGTPPGSPVWVARDKQWATIHCLPGHKLILQYGMLAPRAVVYPAWSQHWIPYLRVFRVFITYRYTGSSKSSWECVMKKKMYLNFLQQDNLLIHFSTHFLYYPHWL